MAAGGGSTSGRAKCAWPGRGTGWSVIDTEGGCIAVFAVAGLGGGGGAGVVAGGAVVDGVAVGAGGRGAADVLHR
jgi:hypothetical protein